MKAIIFSLALAFPMLLNAQELSDSNAILKPVDQELSEVEKEFQISFDVSSMTAVLLGGNTESSFHLGLQVKRVIGNTAYRFTGEFYPQTRLYPFFSNRMLEEASGDEVRYLVFNERSRILRLGFGLEKRKDLKWGKGYLGMDMSLIGETVDLSSTTYWESPNDTTPTLSTNWNFRTVNSFGVGIAPLIGYEFQPWEHFGFNFEAKLDAMMMVAEGHQLDREPAQINAAPRFYDFRSAPLLNLRVHYRF